MRFTSGLVILVAAMLAAVAVRAQEPARKQMNAVRVETRETPRIDGKLDDPVWSRVQFTDDFTAKQPIEGAAPSVRTEIAFLYDQDAIYVGARMHNRRPWDARLVANRRDSFNQSEVIVVCFDTFLDRRTAYTFGITPAGVKSDYFQPSDGELSRDWGYDPVWEGAAHAGSDAWTMEMRIPFSQLRFNDIPAQVWGLNIDRFIPSRTEDIFWVMIPRADNGWSSRFGNLVGIKGIRPSRRLELLPYVTSNASFVGAPDASNPFLQKRSAGARAGGDIKMGLGPNLTLEATINPDFGQVEADPAEVNLSAFETVFAEKRPFFAEGADLLQSAGFFNSRRIGAPPHLTADGDYIDQPENSTIFGAAKLTGRLPGQWSIGALSALTGREYARTFTLSNALRERVAVEPFSAYGLLRTVKQFGASSSTVGGMITGVQRDVNTLDSYAAAVNRQAVTGGIDWNLRTRNGAYAFSGSLGGSYIAGEAASIARVQRASAHYLQRPDQSHLHYDTTRTDLTGYVLKYRFDKLAGRHWLADVWGELETPTLELNDVGRLTAADDIDTNVDVRYRENKPGPVFYAYNMGVSAKRGYNFGWVHQFSQVSGTASFTLRNFANINLFGALNAAALSDNLTRGGPLMNTPPGYNANITYNSNSRAFTNWKLKLDYTSDDLGTDKYELSGMFQTRPRRMWLSIEPRWQHGVDARQYVNTVAGGARTFGQRYIFARIDRSTLSAQIRALYSFRPELVFELYAEPFASRGRYYEFGELSAARSITLRQYGTDGTTLNRGLDREVVVSDHGTTFVLDNPDFNVRSFRSSAVMRWEWRRGSALYLVWQQRRSAFDPSGIPLRAGDVVNSLTDAGDHYLAVKVTYWLPFK